MARTAPASGRARFRAVLAVFALLVLAGWGPTCHGQSGDGDDQAAIAQANSLSRAFRSAAKSVIPTVVTVRTITRPRSSAGSDGRDGSTPRSPLDDLFGDSSPFQLRRPNVPLPGMGSGVVIGQGVVLTNNHVVEGADEVTIDLADGRRLPVQEVKTDPQTDLAVLRFESPSTLPVARLGDSDKLDIGDWVIAVGNPFELEQTVSAGIISAKGRSLGSVERARFLQTDAAINPGNSGGPLVNLAGEVVGINTAIFSRSGGYQGIGFAIPINLAKWVTPQLVETGSVRRAYLGVRIGAIAPERSEQLGVAPNGGVVVERVMDGSPAEEAGFRRNDVILSFDGRPTPNVAELQEIVERSQLNSEHQLEVVRDGKQMEMQVVVAAMPEGASARAVSGSAQFYTSDRLGLTVVELTSHMAQRLGFDDEEGALIMRVDRARPAGREGLQEGMLVRTVNGKSIASVDDFIAAVESGSLEEGITLEIKTRSGSRTVTLRTN